MAGLLAGLSTVLEGVGLTIARATIQTSENDIVSNEFWVQEPGADGPGPVLERFKRRAIEQRLRQWSAGERRDNQEAPSLRRVETNAPIELPDWHFDAVLESHPPAGEGDAEDEEQRQRLINALAAALTTSGVSWLGALPPVLARRTAESVLPRMSRLRLAEGSRIDHKTDDFLILLEDEFSVICALARPDDDGGGNERSPAPSPASSRQVFHSAGSVLCLTAYQAADLPAVDALPGSFMRTPSGEGSSSSPISRRPQAVPPSESPKLVWQSLDAPFGGVVSVVGRAALLDLLGETRISAVRQHSKELARSSAFGVFLTSQVRFHTFGHSPSSAHAPAPPPQRQPPIQPQSSPISTPILSPLQRTKGPSLSPRCALQCFEPFTASTPPVTTLLRVTGHRVVPPRRRSRSGAAAEHPTGR